MCSFRLFQNGKRVLHPGPHDQAKHKERPQPSPIPTGTPGRVNQVVVVLIDTHASRDALCMWATAFRWDILTYLKKKHQRKSMSSVNQSSSIPQELHPSLSAGFFFSHSIFQLFMTTQPRSIFPSSCFSPHHPLPHLQCHLCQLWLAFFGFSKKMSPGIVPHSLLDTKAVPKLKHEANIFPGISSSARQWWWQLTAIRRTRLYTLTSWTKEIQYLVVKTPGKPHNCSYYRGIFSFHPITCCRHSCLVSKWQNFLRAIT